MHVGCPRCGYAFEVTDDVVQAEPPPPVEELPPTEPGAATGDLGDVGSEPAPALPGDEPIPP